MIKNSDIQIMLMAIEQYNKKMYTGDRLYYADSLVKDINSSEEFKKILSDIERKFSDKTLWDGLKHHLGNTEFKRFLKKLGNNKAYNYDIYAILVAELQEAIPESRFSEFLEYYLKPRAYTYVRDIVPKVESLKAQISDIKFDLLRAENDEEGFLEG